MDYFLRIRNIHILIIILILLSFSEISIALQSLNDDDLSGSSPALVDKKTVHVSEPDLQPINEKQLDELSPSLVAPPKTRVTSQEIIHIKNQAFENSVCFKKCHQSGDFSPSDNTAKQWRLLIDQEGHAIFAEIPWENPQQKKEILDYLLNNARNTKPDSAGIGVW